MTTLEEFSDLVGDIYDAALDPALWDKTLRRVFFLAGGNNSALVVYDRNGRRRPHIIAANFDPTQNRKYDEYFSQIDPLAPVLRRSRIGVLVTARAVVNESQRCGEFYTDWAHPNETGDTVFVNLVDGIDGTCIFMVGHPWCSEPFPTSRGAAFRELAFAASPAGLASAVGLRPFESCPGWCSRFGRSMAARLYTGFLEWVRPLLKPRCN